MIITMPNKVKYIIDTYYSNNYEAFMVGGCVRDCLLGKVPNDFDITTSASPDICQKLFSKTISTGIQHGTVSVVIDNECFEVTTYRTEGDYLDNRRPNWVKFVSNIRDDLSRRDFTINALAYNDKEGLIDYFDGLNDLNNKIIRAVGDANKRFQEDALRMLRAIRFSCQLNFSIESETYSAIKTNYHLIENISIERIRDELCKILISDNASKGLDLLRDCGILKIILPEIYALVDYTPKCNNHNKNVFSHTLKVIDNTNSNLILRLSALFHDVGKLNTLTEKNGHYYFPGHSEEGAILTKDILIRFKFDKATIKTVCALIYDHLVLHVSHIPTDGEIKRLINRVGVKNIFTLMELQRADINSLSEPPLFLKKVAYMYDRAKHILNNAEPLSIKDLDIDGVLLAKELNIKPGKIIGEILNLLLDRVLDDKDLNTKSQLLSIAKSYLNQTNINLNNN